MGLGYGEALGLSSSIYKTRKLALGRYKMSKLMGLNKACWVKEENRREATITGGSTIRRTSMQCLWRCRGEPSQHSTPQSAGERVETAASYRVARICGSQ